MAKNLIKGDSSIVDLNTGYDGLELDISKLSIGDKFCISFNFDANYNRANEKTEIVIFEIDYIRCIVATPTSGTYSAVIEVKPYEIADNSLKLFVMGAGDGEDQYCTITNVMLVKGDQPAEWKPWSDISEYKYTLKKVEKSNSKNLIVGDTKEVFVEGTVLFKIQGPITKGDKIVINGKYSELFDGEIYIIINDGNTNRFDQLFYDDEIFVGFPFILNAKRDSIGDITLEITTLIESVILENLMLNEGDTPLPWENNLGDQEITIREIKKNTPSKNLIIGDSREASPAVNTNIRFKLDKINNVQDGDLFCLTSPNIREILNGNTAYRSVEITSDIKLISPRYNANSGEFSDINITSYGGFKDNNTLILRIIEDAEGPIYLQVRNALSSQYTLNNLMLVQGITPLPWENNINPEVSLSPIYKNDKKVWEKEEQLEPWIIKDDLYYEKPNLPDRAHCTVLINPKIINNLISYSSVDEFNQPIESDLLKKLQSELIKYTNCYQYSSVLYTNEPWCEKDKSDFYLDIAHFLSSIKYPDYAPKYNPNGNFEYENGYIKCYYYGQTD